MTFQTAVFAKTGFGVPGELYSDAPSRAQPGIIDSAGPNTIGFAFTRTTGGAASDGHATVGGAIAAETPFFGILANPKVGKSVGTSGGGTLAPTLNLLQYENGEFVTEGEIIVYNNAAAFSPGDPVGYTTATGAIVSWAWATAIPGATTAIPGARVSKYSGSAAGLCVIELNGLTTPMTIAAGTGPVS